MIITFAHYKGGTGKTTSCLSVAGWLARHGKKVLVVDLDPQANATSGLGMDTKGLEKSVYDIMIKKRKVSSVIVRARSGIDVVPGSSRLSEISLIAHRNKKDARILKEALEEVRNKYDYILIDTPPVHGRLIINGIIAADRVILVLDVSVFSFQSLITLKDVFSKVLKKFDEEFNVYGVFVTRCQKGLFGYKKQVMEIKDKISGLLGINSFLISYSEDIYESQKKKIPISLYNPRCKVSKEYGLAVKRLLKV